MTNLRVDILVSGIWQMTSTVLSADGVCVVIDPGYFPRELEDIARAAATCDPVRAVVFTHSHWDHIMGHSLFPGVPVWCSQVLHQQIVLGGELAQKGLDEAREFDSRWYVHRPAGYHWPDTAVGLADGQQLDVGELRVQALHLPGHSPDGLGLLLKEHGLLVVGDHLSPCEIPFIDNIQDYMATLRRLVAIIDDGVERVIPGHGHMLSAVEARAIARADLDYMVQLEELARKLDADALRSMVLPRAGDVVGMREHHVENCAKLGIHL